MSVDQDLAHSDVTGMMMVNGGFGFFYPKSTEVFRLVNGCNSSEYVDTNYTY